MGRPLKWQANPVMQQIVAKNRQADEQERLHWLELQKPDRYIWRSTFSTNPTAKRTYYRRLGVVESLFDSDGAFWEGRADLHQNLRYELRTSMSDNELRERLILAWTLMRHSHVLLSCRAVYLTELAGGQPSLKWTDKCFAYDWPQSTAQAIEGTRRQITFVADQYPNIDEREFFRHITNTARALDPNVALSKLYVMPSKKTDRGTTLLHFIPILAHQITDGLTTYRWSNHFVQIMNMSEGELMAALDALFTDEAEMVKRLPPAQEALYPRRSQSPARERWHWVLTRILRHVRRAPPAAFQNPLRRARPLTQAEQYPTTYNRVLEYSKVPPLNAGSISADLHGRSVANMRQLCKQAGISIGSGCFVLVAMVMMVLEEHQSPDTPLEQRLPFVGSFPVNPRPFLSGEPTTGRENSCMLAFSDGVTLPFLPHELDFACRFRLLGRLAHKQLRQYQKRKRSDDEEVSLGTRSPSQLIPALYCSTLERMEDRMPLERKAGVNVQGNYPAKIGSTLPTCGISSVGDISGVLSLPKVDLDNLGDKDIATELRGMASVVRPREGEFLVGSIGNKDRMGFLAAFDANTIDPAKAATWKDLMESMLDRDLHLDAQARL